MDCRSAAAWTTEKKRHSQQSAARTSRAGHISAESGGREKPQIESAPPGARHWGKGSAEGEKPLSRLPASLEGGRFLDSGIFFTVETDEDFLRLCTDWLSWRMISKELGVGRSRAHQIMGTFAPEDCASVSVQIPGYDSRVCKYVRRAAFENLMRRRRGNPKWKDTAFQQEMARRRWEGHKKGPLPPADEVRVIHI